MTTLLFLIVAALWIVVAFFLARLLTKVSRPGWLRATAHLLIFAFLLPLPIADEIVAKGQFEALCAANAKVIVDREKALGKTVYLIPTPEFKVPGTWVPMYVQPHVFEDAAGEKIISYNTMIATGGLLVRSLGIFEGGMPLVFSGTCASIDIRKLMASMDITALDRPTTTLPGR